MVFAEVEDVGIKKKLFVTLIYPFHIVNVNITTHSINVTF